MTKCANVCIDMFCFYSKISCRSHVVKSKTPKVKIDDFSDGRETCPVVLINEISEDLPPHLAYISSRNKAEDVYINIDPGFLVCCDCTDFCQVDCKVCYHVGNACYNTCNTCTSLLLFGLSSSVKGIHIQRILHKIKNVVSEQIVKLISLAI